MRKIIVLAALCIGISAPAVAEESCNLTRMASVDMNTNYIDGVVVPMTIVGQTVDMVVDTGGVLTSLRDTTADRLGLNTLRSAIELRVFGGAHVDRYTVANEVDLGGLKAHGMPFVIFPHDVMMGAELGGTIAPDVLTQYDVDFDFANAKFNLFSRNHCPGKVVYWTTGPYETVDIQIEPSGHITVAVELDGHSFKAIIDTGSTVSVLELGAARNSFSLADDDPSLKAMAGVGGKHVWRYPFKTLTMQGITVNNPDIELFSNDETHFANFNSPRMILGLSVLRQMHVYISYREHKMYLTSASAH